MNIFLKKLKEEKPFRVNNSHNATLKSIAWVNTKTLSYEKYLKLCNINPESSVASLGYSRYTEGQDSINRATKYIGFTTSLKVNLALINVLENIRALLEEEIVDTDALEYLLPKAFRR